MAEYIDRQAALDALCDGTFEDAEISIRLIPVADVAPVVHGRWIRMPSDIGTIDVEECSICGCGMTERNQFWNAKFCPECGARME